MSLLQANPYFAFGAVFSLPRASAVKMLSVDDQGGVEAARHPSFVVRWYSLAGYLRDDNNRARSCNRVGHTSTY